MPHTAMIEQRLRFLEIDHIVIENLHDARQILEPEMDQMLGAFYAHISSEPQLKELFEDDEAMARARGAQKNHWLDSLLAGEFTSEYLDRAEHIGLAHARVGLTPSWYVGGYSNMLAQFVHRVSAHASTGGYDASPMIAALCKAVMLDIDLVIHSYLEAKDRVIFDLLLHATRFIDDLVVTNGEARSASEKLSDAAELLLQDAGDDNEKAKLVEDLLAHAKVLKENSQQLDERLDELKSGEQLYLQRGADHTGTFSQLVSRIIEE